MERYTYVSTLSAGAYGVVYLCLDSETGRYLAAKGIRAAHTDTEVMRLTLREVKVLRMLPPHPNVVRLLEAFRSKSGRVYLVFEYVERSLYQEMDRHPSGALPGPMVKSVAWQLLHALDHCHSHGVVHRDLKPANVLLTGYVPGVGSGGMAKLCDFGFARLVPQQQAASSAGNSAAGRKAARGRSAGGADGPGGGALPYNVLDEAARLSSYVMTRWYRPPEVLVGDSYGTAIDVWSLGCMLAELATGRPLFPGSSTVDQLWRIMRCLGPLTPGHMARIMLDNRLAALAAVATGPPPPRSKTLRHRLPEISPELLDVVSACLTVDPRRRPTVRELLQMPYFWDVPRLLAGTDLARQLPYASDLLCTISAASCSKPATPSPPAGAGAVVAAAAAVDIASNGTAVAKLGALDPCVDLATSPVPSQPGGVGGARSEPFAVTFGGGDHGHGRGDGDEDGDGDGDGAAEGADCDAVKAGAKPPATMAAEPPQPPCARLYDSKPIVLSPRKAAVTVPKPEAQDTAALVVLPADVTSQDGGGGGRGDRAGSLPKSSCPHEDLPAPRRPQLLVQLPSLQKIQAAGDLRIGCGTESAGVLQAAALPGDRAPASVAAAAAAAVAIPNPSRQVANMTIAAAAVSGAAPSMHSMVAARPGTSPQGGAANLGAGGTRATAAQAAGASSIINTPKVVSFADMPSRRVGTAERSRPALPTDSTSSRTLQICPIGEASPVAAGVGAACRATADGTAGRTAPAVAAVTAAEPPAWESREGSTTGVAVPATPQQLAPVPPDPGLGPLRSSSVTSRVTRLAETGSTSLAAFREETGSLQDEAPCQVTRGSVAAAVAAASAVATAGIRAGLTGSPCDCYPLTMSQQAPIAPHAGAAAAAALVPAADTAASSRSLGAPVNPIIKPIGAAHTNTRGPANHHPGGLSTATTHSQSSGHSRIINVSVIPVRAGLAGATAAATPTAITGLADGPGAAEATMTVGSSIDSGTWDTPYQWNYGNTSCTDVVQMYDAYPMPTDAGCTGGGGGGGAAAAAAAAAAGGEIAAAAAATAGGRLHQQHVVVAPAALGSAVAAGMPVLLLNQNDDTLEEHLDGGESQGGSVTDLTGRTLTVGGRARGSGGAAAAGSRSDKRYKAILTAPIPAPDLDLSMSQRSRGGGAAHSGRHGVSIGVGVGGGGDSRGIESNTLGVMRPLRSLADRWLSMIHSSSNRRCMSGGGAAGPVRPPSGSAHGSNPDMAIAYGMSGLLSANSTLADVLSPTGAPLMSAGGGADLLLPHQRRPPPTSFNPQNTLSSGTFSLAGGSPWPVSTTYGAATSPYGSLIVSPSVCSNPGEMYDTVTLGLRQSTSDPPDAHPQPGRGGMLGSGSAAQQPVGHVPHARSTQPGIGHSWTGRSEIQDATKMTSAFSEAVAPDPAGAHPAAMMPGQTDRITAAAAVAAAAVAVAQRGAGSAGGGALSRPYTPGPAMLLETRTSGGDAGGAGGGGIGGGGGGAAGSPYTHTSRWLTRHSIDASPFMTYGPPHGSISPGASGGVGGAGGVGASGGVGGVGAHGAPGAVGAATDVADSRGRLAATARKVLGISSSLAYELQQYQQQQPQPCQTGQAHPWRQIQSQTMPHLPQRQEQQFGRATDEQQGYPAAFIHVPVAAAAAPALAPVPQQQKLLACRRPPVRSRTVAAPSNCARRSMEASLAAGGLAPAVSLATISRGTGSTHSDRDARGNGARGCDSGIDGCGGSTGGHRQYNSPNGSTSLSGVALAANPSELYKAGASLCRAASGGTGSSGASGTAAPAFGRLSFQQLVARSRSRSRFSTGVRQHVATVPSGVTPGCTAGTTTNLSGNFCASINDNHHHDKPLAAAGAATLPYSRRTEADATAAAAAGGRRCLSGVYDRTGGLGCTRAWSGSVAYVAGSPATVPAATAVTINVGSAPFISPRAVAPAAVLLATLPALTTPPPNLASPIPEAEAKECEEPRSGASRPPETVDTQTAMAALAASDAAAITATADPFDTETDRDGAQSGYGFVGGFAVSVGHSNGGIEASAASLWRARTAAAAAAAISTASSGAKTRTGSLRNSGASMNVNPVGSARIFSGSLHATEVWEAPPAAGLSAQSESSRGLLRSLGQALARSFACFRPSS